MSGRPEVRAGSGPSLAPHPLTERALDFRRRRRGELDHDIALFALLLREAGVPVPVAAVLLAERAAAMVRVEDAAEFRTALRCCTASGPREQALFDAVFGVFWAAQPAEVLELAEESGPGDAEATGGGQADQEGQSAGEDGRDAAGSVALATYSRSGKDTSKLVLGQQQRKRIDELARRIARALGVANSRRMRTGSRGDVVDLRDSFRHNLRYGEELLALRYSAPVRERARLVVLCDVSSSMRPHVALFLSFVHALTRVARSVETAVFNVESAFVTDVFRRYSLSDALGWLRRQSVALAGGTRIGHCMHTFTSELEGRAALRARTTAVVLSDGWDVGDEELLRREIRRLASQVGRLVWLDPHAARTGYQPQVHGLRTVLPFVDDYLDFSTVDSLGLLVDRLEKPVSARKGIP